MWIFSVRLAIGSIFFDADHETPFFVAKGQYCRGIHGVIEAPSLNLSKLGFFLVESFIHADDDGPLQIQVTGETVMRYHLRWKHREPSPGNCAAQQSQQYSSNKSKVDGNTLALILRIPEKNENSSTENNLAIFNI